MNYTISKVTKDPNYKMGAPFHGDRIFIDILMPILSETSFFIETGSAYGDTLKFMVDNFPQIKSISCEPDEYRYQIVTDFINGKADIIKETSPQIFDFIRDNYPESFGQQTVFWLDAHGDFNGTSFWPLREEIEFIKKNFEDYYIFIDDFKNPYIKSFSYDVIGGIECGLDYIQDLVHDHNVYFPNYTDIVNDSWHTLTGWVLITKKKIEHNKILIHR